MNTIVQFIGIFVLMYGNHQYQILIPKVNGPMLEHVSLIAFKQRTRTNPDKDWPVEKKNGQPITFTYQGVTYEYVLVKKEFITISGSDSSAPDPITANQPPHLSCCCNALRKGGPGFKDIYTDPNLPPAAKGGAQVLIDRGVASSVESGNGRLDTRFAMNTPATAGITITGTKGEGANVKTIALEAGTSVIFGNTPMCVYSDVCPMSGDGDFKFYYAMAKEPNTCQGTPSNCSQCRMKQTEPCEPGQKCTILQKTTSASTKTSKLKPRYMINIDCSNSQYP
jgi:hypothetical protein